MTSHLLDLPIETQERILRYLPPIDVQNIEEVYKHSGSQRGREFFPSFRGLKRRVSFLSLTQDTIDWNVFVKAYESILTEFPFLSICVFVDLTVDYIQDQHRIDGNVEAMFRYGVSNIEIIVRGSMVSIFGNIPQIIFTREWFIFTKYDSITLYRGFYENNKKHGHWIYTERIHRGVPNWIQYIAMFNHGMKVGRWEGRNIGESNDHSNLFVYDEITFSSFYHDGYLRSQIQWDNYDEDRGIERTYSPDGRVISVVAFPEEEQFEQEIPESDFESDLSEMEDIEFEMDED